jgi:predicted RNA binding protein YcfA (HicA-like mRNA interferase family)
MRGSSYARRSPIADSCISPAVTPRLKRLGSRDVLSILRLFGFEVQRTRGSHATLVRTMSTGERQVLTIPLHKAIAPGTPHAIFRQAAKFVAAEELRKHFYTR